MRGFADVTIVFVSGYRRPGVLGRVDRRFLRVMRALIAEGAGVHLICQVGSPMADAAREMGAEVAPYRLDRVNFLRTRSRVRKYLRRYRPAIVHSTGLEGDLLVRLAAKELDVRIVDSLTCTSRSLDTESPIVRRVARGIDESTRDRVAAFVVDCAEIAEELTAEGVDRERIVVDHPSVDIGEVREAAEPEVKLPHEPGSALVGYAGRVEPSRGLETLAAAAPILELAGHPASVIVAGDGPALAELRRAPFASYVTFLGAVDSVPAVLRALDVCCFPSLEAGVPTTLLEAAALGRPIVAAHVAGVEELFEDGREIALVPPGDPPALAHAVAGLLSAPEEAAEMAERARLRTVDEYSAPASVERHLALYRTLTPA